jgi:hypothetical protein
MTVERHQKPSRKKRLLGTLKGEIQVLEPESWKPMSDGKDDTFVEPRDVRLLLDTIDLCN